MRKMSGENDNKIVNLDEFRKQKHTPELLEIHVDGYYANLEMGVYLHVVGITEPMHTKDADQHFIVEDHFGNIVTFRIDDPPPDFVVSNMEEFAAAAMGIPDSDDPQVS